MTTTNDFLGKCSTHNTGKVPSHACKVTRGGGPLAPDPAALPIPGDSDSVSIARIGSVSQDVWSLFELDSPTSSSLESFLESLLDRCAAWFQATGASIFLRTGSSNEFHMAAKAGTDSRVPKNAVICAGEGLAGSAIRDGKPLLLNESSLGDHLSPRAKRRHQIGSAMVVPLLTGELGCLGVLNLSRTIGEAPYTDADLHHVDAWARQVALAVANARLIARLNEAAAAAKAARNQIQSILDSLGVGIFVVDCDGAVTHCNPALENVLGDRAPARREILPPHGDPDDAVLRTLVQTVQAALNGESMRRRAHDPDLGLTWSVVATPITGGGAAVAVEDISLHERSQRELGRIKRLAEIGQMTAAIAHEIRNPLTGIISAAQMIMQFPETAAELAPLIFSEASKLDGLCTEFLDFAKPASLRAEPADLPKLVESVAQSHQSEFDIRGVNLVLNIAEPGPQISIDARRVEQVVHNLVRNALQACGPGGTVEVKAWSNGFQIRDNGVGMTPETVDKLFTAFFTTKSDGTGLGLNMVQKILDAHGATIQVESTPGEGTTMDVRFSQWGTE